MPKEEQVLKISLMENANEENEKKDEKEQEMLIKEVSLALSLGSW